MPCLFITQISAFSFLRPILVLIFSWFAVTSGYAEVAPLKNVVVSFSILGDLVKNVAGDAVIIDVLVGSDSDAHAYSPTPVDAQKIARADLIIINGLHFEGSLERVIKTASKSTPIIEASKGIFLPEEDHVNEKGAHSEDEHGHNHALDPHAWQDVQNVKIYIQNIKAGLIRIDPANKETYEENASKYLIELDTLDKDIRASIASIPEKNRKIASTHDAFGYFERAYGITFIPLQKLSTDFEPSAKDVAALISLIKSESIKAIFVENMSDKRLMERIAKESGVTIGGVLFSDALSSKEGAAPTYLLMMRANIKTIHQALSQSLER